MFEGNEEDGGLVWSNSEWQDGFTEDGGWESKTEHFSSVVQWKKVWFFEEKRRVLRNHEEKWSGNQEISCSDDWNRWIILQTKQARTPTRSG